MQDLFQSQEARFLIVACELLVMAVGSLTRD